MRIVREQSDIKQQFQGAVLRGDFSYEANAFAGANRAQDHIAPKTTEHDRQIQDGQAKAKQVLLGMGEGKELSGGNRGTGAVDAARERAQLENREKKALAADMLLLAMLDDLAVLDAEIDAKERERETLVGKMDDIQQDIDDLTGVMNAVASGRLSAEDAMQNPEVAKIIREYGQRKGTTFDANADGADGVLVAILGANVEQRVQEYNDLGQRVEDIDTDLRVMGTQRDALRERIGGRDVRALTDYDAARAESIADANSAYVNAKEIGRHSITETFVSDGSDSQDGQSLEELATEDDFAAEDSFAGFDMGPSDKLAAVSENMSGGFKVAASEPEEMEVPNHSHDAGLDLSVKA